MGRGRQKAKHTKVARDLKYFSPNTDYNALEKELTGHSHLSSVQENVQEDLDKWPEYASNSSDDFDDDDESTTSDEDSDSKEPHSAHGSHRG